MLPVGDYRMRFESAERVEEEDVLLPVCEHCGKATSAPVMSALTGDVLCGAECLAAWEVL